MSRPTGGQDGLNRMLVLGALTARPANRYELDRLLQRRFKSADLSRGTAHHAIKTLLKEELVRPVASQRRGRAQIYEPTEQGLAEFGEWQRTKARILPIREELTGMVGMCQPEHVPWLVEATRETEQDLMALLDTLNRRVRDRRRALDPRSWETRIDLAISCADHAVIGGRVCFAQQLHRHLVEELSQPYSDDLSSDGRRIA
ncbi:MAG: hypothetical protein WAU69_06700 [Solirubrobacteraceae bacterium]